MGILSTLLRPKNTTARDPESWFVELWGGGKTTSGTYINEVTAWNIAAVYACIRIVSETVSTLPQGVYREMTEGREKLSSHYVKELLDYPNDEMTPMVFKETMQAMLMSWGNCYAEIQRNGINRPVALWPLQPSRVDPVRNDRYEIEYIYTEEDGKPRTIRSRDMFHIPGLGFDGIKGQSPIRLARESLGLSAAAEQFGSAFFGNGANPGGVLQHPGILSDEAQARLKKSFLEQTSGNNNRSPVVLEEGLTWSQLSIPPEDAQFLETRKFQVEEIARWYNVPPHKIGSLDKATFSNITEQNIEYATDTIKPYTVRWDQELKRKLFAQTEKNLYVKTNLNALMAGDPKTRAEFYTKRYQMGSLSADDIRELEDENPLPDGIGSKYYRPLNMQELGAEPEPQPQQPQEPEEPEEEPTQEEQNLLRKLIESTSRQVANKEYLALKGMMGKRKTKEEIQDWLDNFFFKHEAYVSEVTHLPTDTVKTFVDSGREKLVTCGANLSEWVEDRTNELTEIRYAAMV